MPAAAPGAAAGIRTVLSISCLLLVTAAACSSSGSGVESAEPLSSEPRAAPGAVDTLPAEVVIRGFEVLVSDETIDLSIPAALDVDADGNIYVADRRLNQVLVVDPEAAVVATIGGAGGGPGEFRAPRGVAIRDDRLLVIDNIHGVQLFDMEGTYQTAYPARVFFDFDFLGDGGLVASNNRVWARGGLLSALGPDGEERGLIGELPYPDMSEFNLGMLREEILKSTIPDPLRNGALPIAGPDGTLWVVLHTESTVRRYGPDGALRSETRFELPELEAIEAQYYEDFRGTPGGDVFFFPSFAADGVAVGDSLLLLWDTVPGEPGLITVHDAGGAIRQRLLLPQLDMGGGGFTVLSMAVDSTRRRLYVGVSDIATVFGVDIPESVEF